MVWLAFSGLVEFYVIASVFLNIVIRLWMDISPYRYGPNAVYIPPWGFYGLLIATITAIPLVIGMDIARRSKGRELAAGVALTSVLAALTAVGACGGCGIPSTPLPV
jgi:hypothetical protein